MPNPITEKAARIEAMFGKGRLSREEAAKYLGISLTQLVTRINNRQIEEVRDGRRSFIPAEELAEYCIRNVESA